MIAFDVAFTLVMLLTPTVFMLFYRPRPDSPHEIDRARVRSLTRRLRLWTAAGLLVYGALLAIRSADLLGDLPWWMTFGRRPDQLAWLMFFPLWFGLAMPLLVAVRPAAGSPYPAAVRRASLQSRARATPIRARHWIAGWTLYAAATAFVLWRIFSADPPRAAYAILSIALGALPLLIGPWSLRMALREPEPMDARGSDELARAYARHRTAKLWGLYLLCISLMSMTCGAAVLVLFDRGGGIAGGVFGSVIGIGGAAFGVALGNQRTRIRELLDRLDGEGAGGGEKPGGGAGGTG